MLGWLWKFLVGSFYTCGHHWEIEDLINVWAYSDSVKPCGTRYILKCTKCGDMKQRKFGSC